MKKGSLFSLLVLTTMMAIPSAHATPPSSCIDKGTDAAINKAYEENVMSAVEQDGYKGVHYSDIKKTVDDFHDPEYDVRVKSNGQEKTIHVTCDDSGDDQCDCSVAN